MSEHRGNRGDQQNNGDDVHSAIIIAVGGPTDCRGHSSHRMSLKHTASWVSGDHRIYIRVARKVKKLKLLEFTGGCRMSGQFTKVGLNGT